MTKTEPPIATTEKERIEAEMRIGCTHTVIAARKQAGTVEPPSLGAVMWSGFREGFPLGFKTWWTYALAIPLGIIAGVFYGH